MADEQRDLEGDGDKQSENNADTGSSLENFVTDHYQKQKNEGRLDSTDELSEERTQDFFARALAESRRMNGEVNKSNQKLDKIHSEFGISMVNSWQAEHMKEVLQPHEHDLIKQAQYQNPNAPS
ncbi:uncharacterized protein LOC128240885 [Mya arenaria]|uniref:uncharacterized protein LOC128240885 n=1 Tax=Mya arenaria TaxID=6604 RepID=UPI0022E8A39E|nr:uncharacterized protein LOC128240885 [Mya arenaria]